ncbi:putative glycosyl transferase [Los Azufres archaeal virus 1]|nr:putative glycosyl transferase [Los Azufres archaeal virus 1]
MAREVGLYKLLKRGGDILMLDDDVIPTLRISEAYEIAKTYFDSGYDVVCGYYWLKYQGGVSVGSFPENSMQYGLPQQGSNVEWFPLPPIEPSKVDVCGTGFVFLKEKYVEQLFQKGERLFDFKILSYDPIDYITEDVYFFRKFKPKSIVDPKLSALHKISAAYAYTPQGVLTRVEYYID